jgi:excisionase family DNA binding protein
MKVLTIAEAAKVLPLSKTTLYELAQAGETPFRKRGGRWMATEDDLIEWIRTGERETRAKPMPDPMPTARMARVNQLRRLRNGKHPQAQ